MSKTARLYRDTRTANAASSNLDKLNDDLQDVTRIMTKNMEELLWRGDSLDREFLSFVSHLFLINHPLPSPPFNRNVASINVVTLRVRKIPKSCKKYKLPSGASSVCSFRRHRSFGCSLIVLEVFLSGVGDWLLTYMLCTVVGFHCLPCILLQGRY
jgi:hypothetical protein